MSYELTVPADLTTVRTALGLQLLQHTYDENRGWNSAAALVPADDTTPLVAEMPLAVVSRAFTPRSATSKIIITVEATFYALAAAQGVIGLYKDATTTPLKAGVVSVPAGLYAKDILTFSEASGSLTARTYRFNIGAVTNTVYINGSSASRYLGGALAASMSILEVQD